MAVDRVERPHIVGSRDVQHVVHDQYRTFDGGSAHEVVVANAANDGTCGAWCEGRNDRRADFRARWKPRRPCQAEVLHVRAGDILQLAVAASRIVARERRPRIRQWTPQAGGIEATLLS